MIYEIQYVTSFLGSCLSHAHFQNLRLHFTDLQDHRAASILRLCPINRQGFGAELKNSMSIIRSSDGNSDTRSNSQAGCM